VEKLITQLAQVSSAADKYIAQHATHGRFVGTKEQIMDQLISLMKVNAIKSSQSDGNNLDDSYELISE
jgi:hypothetical protein